MWARYHRTLYVASGKKKHLRVSYLCDYVETRDASPRGDAARHNSVVCVERHRTY